MASHNKKQLASIAQEAIDAASGDLHRISQEIWSNPEVAFQEHKACQILTDFLEKYGFTVERKYVLETGFRSVVGKPDVTPHVAVLCEYDALPEIGHACGHNLIAEVGVGAAIGIKAALEAARDKGQDFGKVRSILYQQNTSFAVLNYIPSVLRTYYHPLKFMYQTPTLYVYCV